MKTNKTDISLIRRYLNGELDARAMHELEKRAQHDPQLMDVIMGMESAQAEAHEANLKDLAQRIEQRVQAGKTKQLLPWKTWAVAASVLLACGFGVLWFWKPQEEERMAQQSAPPSHDQQKSRVAAAIEQEKKDSTPRLAENSRPKPVQEEVSKSIRPKQEIPDPLAGQARTTLEKQAVDSPKHLAEVQLGEVADEHVMELEKKQTALAAAPSLSKTAPDSMGSLLAGRAAGLSVSRRKLANEPSPVMLSGKITDKQDNSPLPGATVRLKGSQAVAQTDGSGRFSLSVPSKEGTLEVLTIGYGTQQVRLTGQDSLHISLLPSAQTLSEVVVQSRPEEAQPAIGWEAYELYLQAYALDSLGNGGTLTLAFHLNGEGRPLGIKVVKSLKPELDAKAIQLVQEGATWLDGRKNPGKQIRLKIRFKAANDK